MESREQALATTFFQVAVEDSESGFSGSEKGLIKGRGSGDERWNSSIEEMIVLAANKKVKSLV